MKNEKIIFFTDCELWKRSSFKPIFTRLLKEFGIKKMEFSIFKLPKDWEIRDGKVHHDYIESKKVLKESFEKVLQKNPDALFIVDYLGSEKIIVEKKKLLCKTSKDSFMLNFGGNPKNKQLTNEIGKIKSIKPFEQEFIFETSSKIVIDLLALQFSDSMQRTADLRKAIDNDPKYRARIEAKVLDFQREHCQFSPETLAKRMTI